MNIPAVSMALSQGKVQNQFSIAMLDKTIEQIESNAASLISAMDRSMELSVNPNVGANFDASV